MVNRSRLDSSHKSHSRMQKEEKAFRRAFGEKLHSRRVELDLSGREAAESSFVSTAIIYRCETGESLPESDAFIRIVNNLHIDVSDILPSSKIEASLTASKKIDLKEITKEQFTQLFSEAIAVRRKELGDSQGDLAEKIDATQSMVSRWENGTETPRSTMFIRLMKVLQFDPFGIAKAKR